MDRYPLSAYALDYHVDVGVTEPEGVPPMIAQWAASQLWSATSFLVKSVIDLFTWAFSLDLLGGADGALAPISEAITSLYENVIGEAWMVAAILVAGLWGIWKALVQRRYTETAGALGVSVLFVLIALFFVYQPERTVGEASRWTNTLSLAFLSGANRGSLDDPQQAKHQVADHLFETLVYRPWVVLEFGGLEPLRRHRPPRRRRLPDARSARTTRRATSAATTSRPGRDGYGGYAPRYLRQAPGSEAAQGRVRRAARRARRRAATRSSPAGSVDKADSPAVDIQQAGGAFQRLTFAVVIFLGALGAVVLLGTLSLAVILAQVVALVLLGFAPVALVVGIFPRAGHDFFEAWLTKLGTAIFIKALYSLVIALVLAVSAALSAATDSLGFLFAFGLQTLFFWALFIYRKQITARLVAATTGGAHDEGLPRASVIQRGAAAASAPVSALVGFGRRGGSGEDQQESALGGGGETRQGAAVAAVTVGGGGKPDGPDGGPAPVRTGAPGPQGPPGPRGAAGRMTHGDPLRGGGAAPRPAAPRTAALGPVTREATPRESHEAVMRRVLEQYERQRRAKADGERRG